MSDLPAARLTDQWPVVRHPCAGGTIGDLAWRRPLVDGMEATCGDCGTRFRYVRPRPRSRPSGGDGQPQGPRTHF